VIGADRDELEADLAARFPQAMLVANEAIVRGDLMLALGAQAAVELGPAGKRAISARPR